LRRCVIVRRGRTRVRGRPGPRSPGRSSEPAAGIPAVPSPSRPLEALLEAAAGLHADGPAADAEHVEVVAVDARVPNAGRGRLPSERGGLCSRRWAHRSAAADQDPAVGLAAPDHVGERPRFPKIEPVAAVGQRMPGLRLPSDTPRSPNRRARFPASRRVRSPIWARSTLPDLGSMSDAACCAV